MIQIVILGLRVIIKIKRGKFRVLKTQEFDFAGKKKYHNFQISEDRKHNTTLVI